MDHDADPLDGQEDNHGDLHQSVDDGMSITSDLAESFTTGFTSMKSDFFTRYQALFRDRYGLPNDEPEQAREALKHRLYTDYLLQGKLFRAPIGSHPQKIVDLGCGAGHWPMEVADLFPSAVVIGSDISPIQPHWLPSNLEFHIEDLDDPANEWSNVYQGADLIFTRSVLQVMRDSHLFLQRVFAKLRPGGWIECHEIVLPVTWEDGSEAWDHPYSVLYSRMSESSAFSEKYGWEVFLPGRLPAALRDAGFINVSEQHTHVPIGRWHSERRMREMGLLNSNNMADWICAVMNNEKDMGLDAAEADAFAKDLFESLDHPTYRARVDWAVFWAQKPY